LLLDEAEKFAGASYVASLTDVDEAHFGGKEEGFEAREGEPPPSPFLLKGECRMNMSVCCPFDSHVVTTLPFEGERGGGL